MIDSNEKRYTQVKVDLGLAGRGTLVTFCKLLGLTQVMN